MMKCILFLAASFGLAGAFTNTLASRSCSANLLPSTCLHEANAPLDRRQSFSYMIAGSGILTSSLAFWFDDAWEAQARGRATLDQSYERYAPRIRAGGTFYATDLRKLIEANDFAGIRDALAEPPKRTRDDLQKADAGVAERARKSGGFSDARVLVAADLFASAFSESSISSKTKKMQGAVQKMRTVVKEMQDVVNETLGEEKGGFFGIGAKKANPAESAKKLRQLYVQGGNAWNEYVFAANENLALQFDKFEFIK